MIKLKRTISIFLSVIILVSSAIPTFSFGATESQLRNNIMSIAAGEVGYSSTYDNNKYGRWYGYSGAWCTYFVLWCYNNAGCYGGGITPSGGNCNSMISWYKNKGRYHTKGDGYTPKPGDMVFFDFSGSGSSQHVGLVKSISGSNVYTIECNTQNAVKERTYTPNGNSAYNNTRSIMGYASPDFSSKTGGSTATTAPPTTKKPAATTASSGSSGSSTNSKPKTTTAAPSTTAETTTEQKKVEKLSISASTHDLQIGDTVKLNYSIEPSDTHAVVGYFCDEEGIIEIDSGGGITAIGEGTATVVVCVNDELYSQCDFTVSNAVGEVTTTAGEGPMLIVGKADSNDNDNDRSLSSTLTSIGVNVDKLSNNSLLYLIPLTIICVTGIVCIILSVRRKKRDKKLTSELIIEE